MQQSNSTTILFFAWNPQTGEAATGLTGATAYISTDGGTPASASGTVTEISSNTTPGWYKLTLSAAEMAGTVILVTVQHASATFSDVVLTPETPQSLSTTAQNSLIQGILAYDLTQLDSSVVKYCLENMIRSVLLWERAGNSLKIYQTDGTTVKHTFTLSEDGNNNVVKVI